MLKAIVTWALNMRVLVVALSIALIVAGVESVRHAPLDVFPEFAPPMVEIQTEAPGLSTEQVDALVTVPLENSLNGLPWAVVKPPVLMAPYSSLSRAMKIGVTSKSMSQTDLSELALWTMRPRLMSVSGVANVAIWGQRDKEYQVLVEPARLRALGVSLDAVLRAGGDATVIGAGGFLDTPTQRLAVRQSDLSLCSASQRAMGSCSLVTFATLSKRKAKPLARFSSCGGPKNALRQF
jgi:Cu/Ag efflux pump CusA